MSPPDDPLPGVPDTVERLARATPHGERGRTEISGQVLTRIAERAAAEVPGTAGAGRRAAAAGTPRVRARVDGHLAMVHITMGVVYPEPVRQVAERVRRAVTDRVGALTGLDARQVDIDVVRLVPPAPETRRVR
ncbi:hypothetical protein Sru01_12910 [Sphaerisporangium rufum]|uniref:Asp23/Gls24 family envelope stress response protein n=1 Tax=Sphaerisporangium rufum TaxID=1381558 RepID=A0A919QYB1_9ACTN|nr:Asp23/Gls24 family envelope stress response protein [Sphaerisporangium rufum]GII76309.1 hypothetical protein Sru01_12910 [Sphaerisporangium rufum]